MNAGVRKVFDTFALPGLGLFQANQNYQCEATDYTFNVTGPGGLSHSFTDSSEISQMGPDYVYGGFGTDGWSRGGTAFNAAGAASYVVPGWATSGGAEFDVVTVGGGGGGDYGALPGGAAGEWSSVTLKYGTDIPDTTTAFNVNVGAGGTPGSSSSVNGGDGGATSLTIAGYGTTTPAAGGVGGGSAASPNAYGESPGNLVYDNAVYVGGAAQPPPGNGNWPGGGAPRTNAGNKPNTGGAAGGAWVTAVDTTVPGSMYSWAFSDSGPATGPASAAVETSESTTSTTYTDLATIGPEVTVNIGPSGMALVVASVADCQNSSGTAESFISVAASGANTIAASDANSALYQAFTANTHGSPVLIRLFTGLSQGATTFKVEYRVSGGSGTFTNRYILAIPF